MLLAFGLYTLLAPDEREERNLARLAQVRGPGALLLGLSSSLELIAVLAVVVPPLGLRLGLRLSERLRE